MERKGDGAEYYIYVLRCSDNSLYSGITTDVVRRFAEHVEKGSKGAKYTASHVPCGVVALWRCDGKSNASKLEYRLKRLPKCDKEKLCRGEREMSELLGGVIDCTAFTSCEIPTELKVK